MATTNSQRTAEELRNPELNYFIAFKIDLKEIDKTKIEQKIKTELSKTGGSITQRRLLELKDDIMQVMCNDATFDGTSYKPNTGARQREAEAAKSLKLKETVDVIQMLCQTRKTLLKSELLTVYETANKSATYFTKDEFFKALSFLNGLGVKIIENTDVKIPFDKFQKADKMLETLKKQDLYDYLGLNKTASQTEIQDAAKKIYQDSQKTSDLKKKQLGSQLDGIIKDILCDQGTRKSYDQYLVIRTEVWDEFAQRKNFGVKEITMSEYEDYAQTVISLLKVSIQEAETIIAIGCKFFQLTIVGKGDGNTFEYCPFDDCGKLYIKGAKNCPHCGRSLEVMCWNCKQITRITKDDKGCAVCGATYHAHETFNVRCQKLDRLLSSPAADISDLQAAFLDIKNVVPNYAARSDSTVAKKVKEYERLIADRIKQEETIGAKYREETTKIQQLIAKRNYQAALAVARSLQVKYSTYNPDNTKKLIADISAVMQTAQRQVDLAKQYIARGNVSLAISSAAKAIDICDDFTDARQIMQKYPPQAVANLRVVVEKNKVNLTWEDNSKQEFVTYTVIKKIGVAPTSADDGSLVDSALSVRFFEDANIVSATPYYYAVYAERYGVRSAIAVNNVPALIYSDVLNMRQEVVDSGVKVTWEAPHNVRSIEVWRNSGTVAPLRVGEGTKIESTNTGFYDTKCSGESAYLVICNYEVKGKAVQSHGIRSVYKPYEKIAPLENIKIKADENQRYIFTCNEGFTGKVKLYYGFTKLPIAYDTVLKFLDFNVICKGLAALDTMPNANGDITFALPAGKIYQVYPIVCTEQLFIVSPPTLINTLEGISKCSHTVSSGTVCITGALHPKAQAVIARLSNDKYIESVDGGGEKFMFKADDFRKENKIEIKLKTNTVNYITLFTEFKDNGVVSYAPPIKLDPPIDYREAVTVLYSLEYTVSPLKPFKVTLNFEADSEVEIPKMLLMQGSPKPLNKNAGKLCERIEGITLKKGLFSKKYTAKKVITVDPASMNTKFALFLNEDTSRVQMKEVRKL